MLLQQSYRGPSLHERTLGLGDGYRNFVGSSCCLGSFAYVAATKGVGQVEGVSIQMKFNLPKDGVRVRR